MEIVWGVSGTALNQRKYALDLIKSVGLSGCVPVATPLPTGVQFSHRGWNMLSQPDIYTRLVGRLYLNFTCPDLTHAVQQLSQFVAKPTDQHLNAAMHVVKYLLWGFSTQSIMLSMFLPIVMLIMEHAWIVVSL